MRDITANVQAVGLKRPITVAMRHRRDGTEYDLVCGQGRLEAYRELGQSVIPAMVVRASIEECLIMGLVENLARRQNKAIDLLHDVEGMKRRGHSEQEIASYTGLTLEYVRSILTLLEAKEHRLLRAVESGRLPISIAVAIAESGDRDVQVVLEQAYERNLLRGGRLIEAKRLVESRRTKGKGLRPSIPYKQRSLSADGLLKTYRQDAERKANLVRTANATKARLTFIVQALATLMGDANFVALLRAEGLESLPQAIADRIRLQHATSS